MKNEPMCDLEIFPDADAMIAAAADLFVRLASQSITKRGVFSVALSGGSTPEPLYRTLSSPQYNAQVVWDKVHLFWGDERHVPADDPQSNYRMTYENLISRVPIPDRNVHRVPAEMEGQAAATTYEADLRRFFKGDWPQFDLVLLGMGEDGHTASLFPHSAGLLEEQRWFIPNFAPERETWRLTLTKNAINAARYILVLVKGASKASMLAEVFTQPNAPTEKPIQLIAPENGIMLWMADEAAASKLPLADE